MPDPPRDLVRMRQLSEAVILAMVCLAPWAFGAVEAWAEIGLALGGALVAILGATIAWRGGESRSMGSLIDVALAGLVLLGVVQATPLPGGLLQRLDPGAAALRARLLPATPERVAGDPGRPVALSPPTLSQEPGATRDAAARLAMAWVLFRCVLGLGGGYPALRRFGLAITANACVLALFSLVQALTWNGKTFWVRPSLAAAWGAGGPFTCHSHLAAYLNIALGFALAFLLAGHREGMGLRGKGGSFLAAYAAGILIVGIVTSHSRGGFLAMLAAVAAMSFVLRSQSLRFGAGLVAVGLAVLLFLSTLGDSSPYLERLATLFDSGSNDGYTIRVRIWRDAVRVWRAHPVWGTGLGSFAAATAPFVGHDHGKFFARAENEYVDLLVEGGVVGLGLALTGLVGLAHLGWRALERAPTPRDRALVLGASCGVLTLAVHSVSDFGTHIPGVAVAALVAGARLCRFGLDARVGNRRGAPGNRWAILGSAGSTALALLALGLVARGVGPVRAEARLAGAGLPLPGTAIPRPAVEDLPGHSLEQRQRALERALRDRPDWAEGHLRLGLIHLSLYRRAAAELIGDAVKDPEEVSRLADPLWLLGVVHAAEPDRVAVPGRLLEHEPVRDHLVPAARCFLEARRCCPVSAPANAGLASIAFLFEAGEPSSRYAARALEQVGADAEWIAFIAKEAVLIGDLALAARCWRRSLEVHDDGWQEVADAAGQVLAPDLILKEVVPDGRYALWFAGRLFTAPESRATRNQFLRAAIAQLPADRRLSEAERCGLEAEAWAQLGDLSKANHRMESALRLEPRRLEWRKELVGWLLGAGRVKEAHRQALVGLHYAPEDPLSLQTVELTAKAMARGERDRE